jgi:ElaB/YqjD/DUF883 family membrane-anchored ribosome-binding protein
MQRVKDLRERFSTQSQWIQIGLLTASILTPLVNRWNELRAMERARALREDAEERLKSLRESPPWNRRAVQQQVEEVIEQIDEHLPKRRSAPRSSTIIWMVGVGVGVVAAGAGTYLLLKRRLEAAKESEEPFVPLPFRRPAATTAPHPLAAREDAGEASPLPNATAGSVARPETRERPAPIAPDVADRGNVATDTANATDEQPPSGVTDAEDAAFIGNIRTMAYHLPDDDQLPAEENRIYFASEAEAQAAGYHRVHEEIGATENSAAE